MRLCLIWVRNEMGCVLRRSWLGRCRGLCGPLSSLVGTGAELGQGHPTLYRVLPDHPEVRRAGSAHGKLSTDQATRLHPLWFCLGRPPPDSMSTVSALLARPELAALAGELWPVFPSSGLRCQGCPICTRSGQESQWSRGLCRHHGPSRLWLPGRSCGLQEPRAGS